MVLRGWFTSARIALPQDLVTFAGVQPHLLSELWGVHTRPPYRHATPLSILGWSRTSWNYDIGRRRAISFPEEVISRASI